MRSFGSAFGARACVALALLGAATARAQDIAGEQDVAPAGVETVSVVAAKVADAASPAARDQDSAPVSRSSLFRIDPWTTEQKVWAGVSTALILMDWGQTRYISKNPHRFHETNPLMGRHPTLGEVNRHFALSMAANLAVASLLPSKWRTPWLVGVSGMQAHFVIHNKKLGVRMAF